MSRNRKRKPGDVFRKDGALVRIDQSGEEQPFESPPHKLFPEEFPPQPLNLPRRADGTVAPFRLFGVTLVSTLAERAIPPDRQAALAMQPPDLH